MKFLGGKRVCLDASGGNDNPSAIHAEGRAAKARLEAARKETARLLHTGARDIVFTSGGTEADNLAVLGVFESHREKFPSRQAHIVISDIEHPAVAEAAREAERRGAKLSVVPVSDKYLVDVAELMKVVTPDTLLVSVALADGVSGAVEPVQKISRQIRALRKASGRLYPYLHSDATQAASTLDLSVESLGVDLLTLDSGKFGGPACGALVVRPNVSIKPILFGGGQERGLRSGTENVAAIEGFAEALAKSSAGREANGGKLRELKKYFLDELRRRMPEVAVHGPLDPEKRLSNIVAVSVPGILSEFLAVALDEAGVAASAGSACLSAGETDDAALLRFSFDPKTSRSDISRALDIFELVVRRVKIPL